jgi:hypothetical protein
MSRAAALFVLVAVIALMGCAGPICPINAANPDEAAVIAAVAEATGRCIDPRVPAYAPDAVPAGKDAGTTSEACAACVAMHCKAAALACLPASSVTPCAPPDAAYTAVTACVAASCGAPCPGVP